MKKAEKIKSFVIIAVAALLTGCIWDDSEILPPSSGNSGDLVVVMDSTMWSSEIGEEVYKCFSAPQEGLPQSEAQFNVIQVFRHNFNHIFKSTRNIVIIEKGGVEKSTYVLQKNLWAQDQLVLLIKAIDSKAATEIIHKSCDGVKHQFLQEEIERLQTAYEKLKDVKLMNAIEARIGLSPTVPADYKIAFEKESFIWLRKDFEHKGHQVNMGLIMYRSPYDSIASLDIPAIIEERDKQTLVVEGPVEGSFMKVYEEFVPVEREITIDERYVKELRGLWNMSGAFMGGPFVHYSFVDKSGKYLINIDGYVFAPKFDKQDYLRELEAIGLSGAEDIF